MLYKKHKIKKKLIRMTKLTDRNQQERIVLQAAELIQDVRMAIERGCRIIQLDECCVTKSTIPKATWSAKNENHLLDFKQLRCEVKAILCAVSRENGLDFLDVYRHSITKIKFKLFLEGLRRKFPFDNILLVMDNLNLHKSNEVKDRMDELGFLYTYTPAYSP